MIDGVRGVGDAALSRTPQTVRRVTSQPHIALYG